MFLALALLLQLAPVPTPSPLDSATEVRGQVIPADGGSTRGLWLLVRGTSFADSVEADSAGRFSIPLPADLSDTTLELVADAADPPARAYHPARVRLGRADLGAEQRIVLVPQRWTIASGSYAGAAVAVSPRRASLPPCTGCSAFYSLGGAGDTPPPGWPEASFPLRVAFDRDNSDEAVTPADSVALWRIVDAMEADFGSDLFRPARYAETLPAPQGDAPNDVVLVWIVPSLRWAGLGTRAYWGGAVSFAAVWFRRTALLRGPGAPALVTHELLHALGFGHTCGWRSVMADATRCPALRAESATPEDVAYAQMARRVQALQREHGARWGIDAAQDGERDSAPGPLQR